MSLFSIDANADSAQPYLGWTEKLQGPCGTANTVKYVGTVSFSDPATHSVTRYKTVTSNEYGNIQTIEYTQNGVTAASVYSGCAPGEGLIKRYNPTAYKHRAIYNNYYCGAASCQYAYTVYGTWVAGVGSPQ
ncbi:hypothetical protein [Cellulomonas chitinilytica]|uniref:hypothetical protein n=1 Tax=Cellulomonas chitinilytica TaxID=398759 RepID=UPI0019443079|nr:hypothetical protein [Cellulomonas chitinilytica]